MRALAVFITFNLFVSDIYSSINLNTRYIYASYLLRAASKDSKSPLALWISLDIL